MVSTRNQASNAANAEQLVSIPTVYRPSTPGRRPIIQPVPGTRGLASNGEQIRVTRSGIHHAPIPTGNPRTSSSARRASKAATLSKETTPGKDSTIQESSLAWLSNAASKKVEQVPIEAAEQGNKPASSLSAEQGNIAEQSNAEQSNADQMSTEATQQKSMPADVEKVEQGNLAEHVNAERIFTEFLEQGTKPTSPAEIGPGYISQHLNAAAEEVLKRAVDQDYVYPDMAKRIKFDESAAIRMSGADTSHENTGIKHSQQDAASSPGAQRNELTKYDATRDSAADDASMFDNLNEIVDLSEPRASPSYSPILKPEILKEFEKARLKQLYDEAELILNNTNIFDDEPGFEIGDHISDQDPELPSNLDYEHDDPRLAQWREDLSFGHDMDPFTGELERETVWRGV